MRVLRGTSVAAEVAYHTGETPADAGAVTVTVTRGDGRVVVAAAAAAAGADVGEYTYTLSAAVTADVELFTLTWTSATLGQRVTQVEVVGGHLVELAELRVDADLMSQSRYPVKRLVAARDAFTRDAERFCGRAFNPTYGKVEGVLGRVFYTSHSEVRRILSAGVDGATPTVNPEGWTSSRWGQIISPYGWTLTTVVSYEHGLDTTPPDIRDVSVLAIRDRLMRSAAGRPNRVYAESGDLGTTRYSTPGPTRLTGIPDVDAVFDRYRLTAVMVA